MRPPMLPFCGPAQALRSSLCAMRRERQAVPRRIGQICGNQAELQPWRQFALSCETQLPMPRRQRFLTVRLNLWVILAALLALLLATRYLQHEGDTQRICADDPSASVWGR